MIIKIDKHEREQLEKLCAVFDLTCRIYTIENNPNITQAEVTHNDGKELEPATVWYLCSAVGSKVAMSKV